MLLFDLFLSTPGRSLAKFESERVYFLVSKIYRARGRTSVQKSGRGRLR